MNDEKARLTRRAAANVVFVLATAAGFFFAWTAAGIGEGTRRLLSFGATLLFVIFWHEAASAWKRARPARGTSR